MRYLFSQSSANPSSFLLKIHRSKDPFAMKSYARSLCAPSAQKPRSLTRWMWWMLPIMLTSQRNSLFPWPSPSTFFIATLVPSESFPRFAELLGEVIGSCLEFSVSKFHWHPAWDTLQEVFFFRWSGQFLSPANPQSKKAERAMKEIVMALIKILMFRLLCPFDWFPPSPLLRTLM